MSARPDVVILAAKRTAIGRLLGAFKGTSAVELGRQLAEHTLRAAGVSPADVDQTILGCVLQAGLGLNPARQVAVLAGLPVERPAFTLNQVCGSGLKAVELAAQQIWLGEASVVLAGGVENMTRAPHLLPEARQGLRLGDGALVDSLQRDGLVDSFENIHMGCTAERIAERMRITREDQDAFALASQTRYRAARAKLAEEICPIVTETRSGPVSVEADEHPRETSLEALAALRPAFQPDGTITAGNASGITDGAALAVVAARAWAGARGLGYDFVLRGFQTVGVEPGLMGLGPIGAIRGLRERHGLSDADIDLYEINEAFAAQTLGVIRELGISAGKVNVNGGAVALGHPLGATGCRILVTLVHEMRRRGARRGIAALCVGGGMGNAALIEAV